MTHSRIGRNWILSTTLAATMILGAIASWVLTSLPARAYTLSVKEITLHDWSSARPQQGHSTAPLDNPGLVSRAELPLTPANAKLECLPGSCRAEGDRLLIEPTGAAGLSWFEPLDRNDFTNCALNIRSDSRAGGKVLRFSLQQEKVEDCNATTTWKFQSQRHSTPIAQGKGVVILPDPNLEKFEFLEKGFRPNRVSIQVERPLDVQLETNSVCQIQSGDLAEFSGGTIEISSMDLTRDAFHVRLAVLGDWDVQSGLCSSSGVWLHVKRAAPYFWGILTGLAAFLLAASSLMRLFKGREQKPREPPCSYPYRKRWR